MDEKRPEIGFGELEGCNGAYHAGYVAFKSIPNRHGSQHGDETVLHIEGPDGQCVQIMDEYMYDFLMNLCCALRIYDTVPEMKKFTDAVAKFHVAVSSANSVANGGGEIKAERFERVKPDVGSWDDVGKIYVQRGEEDALGDIV